MEWSLRTANSSSTLGVKASSVAVFVILACSIFTAVGFPINAFADTPFAVMNIWSPHSPSAPDGIPTSTFTFSADVTASDGILKVEWDFDGNGTVDGTTPISGAPSHVNNVSTTHVYGFEGVFWPQVRTVDINNVASAWDRYQVGSEDVPMDVFWPPPAITMLQWSPFVVTLGQPVTFSATAFNPVGVQLFEWDFNGDEEPDATSPATPFGAQNASGSIVFTYTSALAAFPSVRALDNDDFLSYWDQYDIDGQPVQLVVGGSAPEVTMNQWSPFSSSGPDGVPTTNFTFSASGTSEDGIARFEWDFNGDSTIDATTNVSGSPESATETATHVFGSVGTWTPKVRLVASNGIETEWTPYLIAGSPVALDVGPPPFEVTLDFSPRAPGDVGPDGDTSTSFTFTATSSNTPVSFTWDFDSDGVDDATTTTATATHTYPVHGSYLPRVKVTDIWGAVQDAVPVNGLGQDTWLDVSPAAPTATLNGWGPYETSGPDGNKLTEFTFSASATAVGGILMLEWDFDGDGTVDATTPVTGAPTSVTNLTITHVFGADGNYTPKVRVVDTTNQASAWDVFNDGSNTPALDIVTPGPVATMLQWSPFATSGPDGNTGTSFTLSADAASPVGIDKMDWDLDGDGTVDSTTEFAGQLSVTGVSAVTTYPAGSYIPKVRVIDMDGAVSAWDEYNQGTDIPTLDVDDVVQNTSPVASAGSDQIVLLNSVVTLDGSGSTDPDLGDTIVGYLWSQVSGPETMSLDVLSPVNPTFTATTLGTFVFELRVTDNHGTQSTADSVTINVVNSATSAVMNQWSPYNASGPDGEANTTFTFSADATTAVGVLKLEWDFDGNGTVDATTDISGAPLTVTGITTTHTYGADGTYTPQVRVVQVGGATSAWDPYDVSATTIQLDVFTEQVIGDTYCNDMTIEQLIASGQYNVIDFRNATGKKTINGTDGKDLILGGNHGDNINAKKGDDCVIAGSGNDIINAQDGNDTVYGNGGNDTIHGQNGNDKLYGGDGNDTIYGSNGDDAIYGGNGNDKIKGDNGNDHIDGGNQTDECDAGNGNDTVVNCEDGSDHNTSGSSNHNSYNFSDDEKDDEDNKSNDKSKNKNGNDDKSKDKDDDKSGDSSKKDNKSKSKDNDKSKDKKSETDKGNGKKDDDKSKDGKNDDKSKDNNGSGNNDKGKDSEDKKGSDKKNDDKDKDKDDNKKGSILSLLFKLFG